MEEGITLAAFTNIFAGLINSFEFFSSSLDTVITSIVTNELLLWPVIFAFSTGTIGLIIKIIRKLGFKGRR